MSWIKLFTIKSHKTITWSTLASSTLMDQNSWPVGLRAALGGKHWWSLLLLLCPSAGHLWVWEKCVHRLTGSFLICISCANHFYSFASCCVPLHGKFKWLANSTKLFLRIPFHWTHPVVHHFPVSVVAEFSFIWHSFHYILHNPVFSLA